MADFGWSLDGMKFLDGTDVGRLKRQAMRFRRIGRLNDKFGLVRNWFIVEVGLEVGLRVMEIADLCCGDLLVDQESPEVVVRRGKGGRRRVVKVSMTFAMRARWFLAVKARAGESIGFEAPVFVARKTSRALCRRQVQKVFERLAKQAELSKHVGIHALRHTYGTHLLRASGGNLRLVQKQLGHSRITTTQVYADVLAEDVVAAVERLYRVQKKRRAPLKGVSEQWRV